MNCVWGKCGVFFSTWEGRSLVHGFVNYCLTSSDYSSCQIKSCQYRSLMGITKVPIYPCILLYPLTLLQVLWAVCLSVQILHMAITIYLFRFAFSHLFKPLFSMFPTFETEVSIPTFARAGEHLVAIFCIVFAHADVTPPVGPPYWITASGLYPLLPCKLAMFSN